jgi:MFS family permease
VGLLKGTWEGLRYALGHPVARALVIGLGFGVLFAAVDDVALVFLAREDLHAGAVGYGVLVSVYGIGFALGSLALLRTRATAGVAVFILGLALSGTGGLLTGLAPILGLAALAQAVAGSGNGLEVVATDTLVQRSVPRSHRGRVFGVVSAATLLGGAIARGLGGALVDLTSARATFVIGGSGVLLVALVAVGLFRGVGRGPVDASSMAMRGPISCRAGGSSSGSRPGSLGATDRLGSDDVGVSWVGREDLGPGTLPRGLRPLDADALQPGSPPGRSGGRRRTVITVRPRSPTWSRTPCRAD